LKEFIVGTNEAGQRLDKLLLKLLPDSGKSFIYKMLRKKNITLNNKKADGSEKTVEGDVVKLWLSDDTINKFSVSSSSSTARDISSDGKYTDSAHFDVSRIIYEDDDILIYDKPAGLLSQKSKPDDISVNDMLLTYTGWTETFKPSICNRLDRNTSGLIVCGKSMKGLQNMAAALKERTAHKDYVAKVKGCLNEGCEIKTEVDDKLLHSDVKPIYFDGRDTYVMVRLHTGKTHQIRMHLSGIGHPIIGDRKYGDGKGAKRQLLHAFRLSLADGRCFEANIPEDFKWEPGKLGDFEDLPWRI